MERFAKGSVVVVPFPYSDLSQNKTRPALVLGYSQYSDLLLCQITSRPFSDPRAISITNTDFQKGSLPRNSFIRPLKLFTASQDIIICEMGILKKPNLEKVIFNLIQFLKNE